MNKKAVEGNSNKNKSCLIKKDEFGQRCLCLWTYELYVMYLVPRYALNDLIKQLKAKVFISFYVCVKYLVGVLVVWDGHGWMEIQDMGVMDVMEVCAGCAVGVVGQGQDWAMT